MEFAGKELTGDSLDEATALLERLKSADSLDEDQSIAKVKEIKGIIRQCAEQNSDTATIFALLLIDDAERMSKSKDKDAANYGGAACRTALMIREHDTDTGSRLLHALLTSHSSSVADMSWRLIEEAYQKGDMSYADYYPFYLIRNLR